MNDYGLIGDGTSNEFEGDPDHYRKTNNQDRQLPVYVKNLNNVETVKAVGEYYNLAILKDKTVMQWGADPFVLDKNTLTLHGKLLPEAIASLNGLQEIAADSSTINILKQDGTVWGWGINKNGALGDGSQDDKAVLTLNSKLSNIVSISGDGSHSIALDTNGKVWAWGFNFSGEVAPGGFSFKEPVRVDIPAIIKVKLNGTVLSFDQYPVIENGVTFVPLRKIFESIGANMTWTPSTQTIDAVQGSSTIQLKVGQQEAIVNGKQVHLDKPPMIRNGRTLVPVRFITEAFGGQASWDGNKRIVDLHLGT